jgi:hypothetical protein
MEKPHTIVRGLRFAATSVAARTVSTAARALSIIIESIVFFIQKAARCCGQPLVIVRSNSGCFLIDALQRQTVELLVSGFLLIKVLLQNGGAVFAAERFRPGD